jgi:alpha-glucosidase/alpha-D-xyloside xylohydrolase
MPATTPSISAGTEEVVLERGLLRVELALRPFSMTVRRAGRRLLRSGGLWVADGTIHDHFVQFTEGVVPREERTPAERALRATVARREPDGVELALKLQGGRSARLRLSLPGEDRISFELEAEGDPLRLALEWDRRSEERYVGLGARHTTRLDQGGRNVQLGADRRYTGPDCPPDMLAAGGIPQGDCAPVPWLLSSRGYGVWVQTHANGTCFDLGGERVSVSTRAHAGPRLPRAAARVGVRLLEEPRCVRAPG